MKKVLLLLLVLMMAVAMVACASSSDEDVSLSTVEENGYITVGFDETFAPMGFKDEAGEYVGFDLELAREVALRLGVELKFQPIDWDSKVLELDNNNIDMIWNGLTITEDRKLEMLFSDPYMSNKQIIIVAGDSAIETKADLADKIVCAQVDSSAMEAINAQPEVSSTFAEIIENPDYVSALTELEIGTVDAVVVDQMTGRYYIQQNDLDFKVLDEDFGDEVYGIGFRQNDVALRNEIQETLNDMIEDGTALEISEKWFAGDVLAK